MNVFFIFLCIVCLNVPNYVYRWYRRNPSFVLFYNIHSLWSGKSSTFESTKVLYAMKQKVLGFEKQDCLHISFMLLLLSFSFVLQIMIILKIQKLIIFFFFYKLVWLIHITYPLWSCNLFIKMTFHIVIVT